MSDDWSKLDGLLVLYMTEACAEAVKLQLGLAELTYDICSGGNARRSGHVAELRRRCMKFVDALKTIEHRLQVEEDAERAERAKATELKAVK